MMSSLNTIADDPWSWSVSHLIAQICHSPALFLAAGCRSENLPDTASLEAQLRDQGITGTLFLTALDSNALRTELGIQSLGQRRALMAVIEVLRRQSVAYKQHATTAEIQTLYVDGRTLLDPATPEVSGRKRQKTTNITTVPLPVGRQPPHAVTGASDTNPEDLPRDASGQWDYLRHWQDVVDDDSLLVDEDISEEEQEEHEELGYTAEVEAMEILEETEDTEEAPGRCKLSRDQIVDIINEQIENFTNTWKNKGVLKGDEFAYNSKSMLEKADAANERQLLVERYETDVAYYSQRLDKLCDVILNFPGNNADKVRRQCANLEVTINSLELSKRLIYDLGLAGSDEEEEQASLHGRSPSVEPLDMQLQPQTGPPTAHRPKSSAIIIDLGSPSESSEGEMDSILVDSSPPPEATHVGEHYASPSDHFHTTDSVIAETVEPLDASSQLLSAARPAPLQSQAQLGEEPENASIASARRWRWDGLVDTQDRKRIVTKALSEMESNDRETIRSRLRVVGKADMIREIPACIWMLSKSETKMQGVLARDMPKIVTFTRLFLCWWLCDNYFRVEPSKWHLEELEECLQGGTPDPSTFCDYLNTIMATTFSPEALQHPEQPSQAEIIEISDEDEPPHPSATQRKYKIQGSRSSRRRTTIVID